MKKNSILGIIEQYASEIEAQCNSGHAKEHAYRPALERLMSSFDNVIAVNDPKRSLYGNPDFVFLNKNNRDIILGYAETKDINISLDRTEKTEQMQRYSGYENLFLTNYLEFRFFQNGVKYQTLNIGSVSEGKLILNQQSYIQLADELTQFLSLPPESIRNGKRLAQIMGAKARRIRQNVRIYLGRENDERNQELEKIYEMIRKLLVHDLTTDKFADMYAQTLVYGLFVARYSDTTPESFSRTEARDLVPASNPFLREFFDHIVGPRFDKRLAYIVDELCEIFSVSDVQGIVHKHLKVAHTETDDKDPIIHFYEDFLKEYDPAERKKMGAYYTPLPIVRFIVRNVDKILQREFGLVKGLADTSKKRATLTTQGKKHSVDFHRVQILDPAVGTATFLNEVINNIYADFSGQEGRWPSYVENDLLPRLHGFELMMAPYTIAHLKIDMTLQETGVKDFHQRLGVYLTNTLEEGFPQQPDLFTFGLAEVVSKEAHEATQIKHERPIMVIIGNPPYSGVSSNETQYANNLIDKYKVEPGGKQKLQERKHWLNNDYVKFIAFSEEMIRKNGEGILAMITDNSYLDAPTFRGMRWHLAKTFDVIYVLDLHGNSKKEETAPDGSKDENVFDITQGVSIIIGVKASPSRSSKQSEVYHAELYGLRKEKFRQLDGNTIEWQKLKLDAKMLFFVPKETAGLAEYEKGIKISDLFIISNTGIVTMGDNFIVAESREVIRDRVNRLIDGGFTEETMNKEFHLGKNYAKWVLGNQDKFVFDESKIVKLDYRPFDYRYTYFDNRLVWRHRERVMQHMVDKNNVGLLLCRQSAVNSWEHVGITKYVADDSRVSNRTKERSYIYPLYLFHSDGTSTVNFKPEILKVLTKNLKKPYGPENILDYVYAVLHSPKYRKKYREFLRIDFPRVPAPSGDDQFSKLGGLGKQLRELHLMTSSLLDQPITTYPVAGNDEVDKVVFKDGKVWINSEQYFGGVSETAWNSYIGGYQPAQKWLKDRKGRKLNSEDIEHYEKIIEVLVETDVIMHDIDKQLAIAIGKGS